MVDESKNKEENCIGNYGIGKRNESDANLVEFCKRKSLPINYICTIQSGNSKNIYMDSTREYEKMPVGLHLSKGKL